MSELACEKQGPWLEQISWKRKSDTSDHRKPEVQHET